MPEYHKTAVNPVSTEPVTIDPAPIRTTRPVAHGAPLPTRAFAAAAVVWIGATYLPIASVCAGGPAPKDNAVSPETKHKHKHTNRLIHATSPYLLQHAHNPVDWYEWGEEAFEKARKEDKPIFLSIGYSACHWCHVMEHESFEDEGIAEQLNRDFVAIKVDREERPDLDEIYMKATTGMTGRGGWPMSVFMTTDGRPFFAGTYFPRESFSELLDKTADAWKNDRASLLDRSSQVYEYLQRWARMPTAGDDLIPESRLSAAVETMSPHFDMTLGAFRTNGNKFPPSMWMEFMLRRYLHTGEQRLLDWVKVTLTQMARGGIYDHIGGGICRYSTDPKWLVPHFEKMLYDQGLVGGIYLDAYQATGDELFAETARGICDYVIRDLQSPQGGFYSTRDADSDGQEGKFYIWTVDQVRQVLGDEDAKIFCRYYDVTDQGNWFESRGHAPPGPKNILNIKQDIDAVAKEFGIDPGALRTRLAAMRDKIFQAREKRVHPGLDDKILTGWNGLAIATLAKAACVFDEPRYAQAAAKAADFVLHNLRKDGKLLRTWRAGQARLTGYLTDYAYFTEGLLNLYEATLDPRYLAQAVSLTDDLIARYRDAEGGGFFFTASDGEQLIARTKDADDGAVPSGNSVAAMNLLRLAVLTGNKAYRAHAESIFRAFAPLVEQSPGGYEKLLCAVDAYHKGFKEIAIVGPPDAPETKALLRTVFHDYRPNKVIAFCGEASVPESLARQIPLLKGKKTIDGKPAAYVCKDYRCKKPVTSPAELAASLRAD